MGDGHTWSYLCPPGDSEWVDFNKIPGILLFPPLLLFFTCLGLVGWGRDGKRGEIGEKWEKREKLGKEGGEIEKK